MRETQFGDDLMGGLGGAGGPEDDEDEDYLDVRTKDILVIHLPDLKVSEFLVAIVIIYSFIDTFVFVASF